jgi:ADP-ribose pyrophosphatase YjhB (NUDIX family)
LNESVFCNDTHSLQNLEFHPIAVDCIVFGFNDNNLELLLIHRGFEPEKKKWSLMGGFLGMDEDLDGAAARVLKDLTGLEDLYMEQVNTFGKVKRDPGARVLSVAYYALIPKDQYDEELIKRHNAKWFPLNKFPDLIFDHKKMVNYALIRLRRKVKTEAIGFNLLPEKFTLTQLQALYETILGEALDKRNFRKKIATLESLVKLNEKDKSSSKRGAFLYQYDKKKNNNKSTFNF